MAAKKATPKTKPILTEKQELFAIQYVLNGRNASQAYRDVYKPKDTIKETTVWRTGHHVLHNAKVNARVHELMMQTFTGGILSVEERKKILSERAAEGCAKSMDMLNKMDGQYITKVEHSGEVTGGFTLNLTPVKEKLVK